MKRRGVLSFLGLAPVAAAMPVNIVDGVTRPPSLGSYAPLNAFSQTELAMDGVEYARKKLDALKWMSSKNVPNDNEHFAYPDPAIHVEAMRSWSVSHKSRVTSELRRAKDQELAIKGAKNRLERELKLSIAPEWVRRFI